MREWLVAFGGRDACRTKDALIPREQLNEMLLKNGPLIESKGAVGVRGPSQHCPDIFRLWREGKLSEIHYGHGLADDMLWRERWWGISGWATRREHNSCRAVLRSAIPRLALMLLTASWVTSRILRIQTPHSKLMKLI